MKKEKVKLSIIIPVYNGEDTIEKCLNSILGQISNESEVIIVDDGSTDKTNSICSKIVCEDSRIKLLKQDNKGVSSARNAGIEFASGKYIMFVDCDDIIENGYFESFLKENELSDDRTIVLSQIATHYADEDVVVIEGSNLNTDKLFYKDMIVDIWDNHLWNSPVNKIYISEIIKNNEIRFNTNVRIGEDWLFNNAYARALDVNSFYIIGDVAYDYYLDKDPWRHCRKDEFYEINKAQVEDFRYTLEKLGINKDAVDKLDKRDLDFTISEIRRIARDETAHLKLKIKQIRCLAKRENVYNRIKMHYKLYSFLDKMEFYIGSSIVVIIWENLRKRLGIIRNGGSSDWNIMN